MLELKNIVAGYSRRTNILHGITASLAEGQRVILLGPNGAGKSTLMRVMAGAMAVRSGAIAVSGTPVSSRGLRRHVSWMPQVVEPIPGVTVAEQIAYAGWAGGLSGKAAWARVGEVLASVDLEEHASQRVAHLSGGQLRRVGLAEALMKDAMLLILDEPTAGLDPAQRRHFRTCLRGHVRGYLVSTHMLDDIGTDFDVVWVMVGGQLVFVGSVADFMALAKDQDISNAEDAFQHFIPSGRH